MGYLDGFGVILSKWLGPNTDTGRRVTTQYPEEVRPKPERFHGRHVLNRYEDGMEKCIGCELCAGVCPAKCIYVRGKDNDPDAPTSPGERFGYVYEINYLRCIHCDLCVEACPTEAITETKMFEFAFTNRQDAIYTKAELLVDDDGQPRRQPWEHWEGGFDAARDTSGWMRATAPNGDADFVGLIAWAGELGYGVRPPQREDTPPEPDEDHGHGGHDDHDDHGHDHGGQVEDTPVAGAPVDELRSDGAPAADPVADAVHVDAVDTGAAPASAPTALEGAATFDVATAGLFDAPEGSARRTPPVARPEPEPVDVPVAETEALDDPEPPAAQAAEGSADAAPDGDETGVTEGPGESDTTPEPPQMRGIFDAGPDPEPPADTGRRRWRRGKGGGR